MYLQVYVRMFVLIYVRMFVRVYVRVCFPQVEIPINRAFPVLGHATCPDCFDGGPHERSIIKKKDGIISVKKVYLVTLQSSNISRDSSEYCIACELLDSHHKSKSLYVGNFIRQHKKFFLLVFGIVSK